jgi:hypothetical protein
MAGVMGSLAAVETIRSLVPFGDDPAGKLLLVDALTLRFRTIAVLKDPPADARPDHHRRHRRSGALSTRSVGRCSQCGA